MPDLLKIYIKETNALFMKVRKLYEKMQESQNKLYFSQYCVFGGFVIPTDSGGIPFDWHCETVLKNLNEVNRFLSQTTRLKGIPRPHFTSLGMTTSMCNGFNSSSSFPIPSGAIGHFLPLPVVLFSCWIQFRYPLVSLLYRLQRCRTCYDPIRILREPRRWVF